MSLDERHARLWQRLGLGPVWTERQAQGAGLGIEGADRVNGPEVRRVASMGWNELEQAVAGCTACGLCKSRTQTVFGVGSRKAQWLVIGEAPGAEEDLRGEPFVGQAGRLLDSILAAAGLSRAQSAPSAAHSAAHSAVYIANVLKCRPPGNRNPAPEEAACCEPYLRRQIELLAPRVILVLGRVAAQALLSTEASIAALRGRIHRIDVAGASVPVIVTYHPAYLLRNLADKAKVWADLCLAREVFGQAAERPLS